MSIPAKTFPTNLNCQSARPPLRWPTANLFRNPFGELTREERAEVAVVDLDPLVAWLTTAGERSATVDDELCDSDRIAQGNEVPREPVFCRFRAFQLIGDCGRGKTTRMLAIHRRFPRSSYVYLPEDEPCPAIPEGTPLLIDEAQRLPWRVRRKVFASGATLILATHNDLTGPLRRAGYQVTTQRIGLTLTADRLAEILNRRLQASRRDPRQPIPQISIQVAEQLIARHGTDIRAIESFLYDIVQAQVNQHGEMRFID
ncbi:hypothetical protein NHH03_08970 [Stieleria sp. TO1_6]|uniref:hypothetical protein n=1 Tax=Stieleria tagensis TaxID=2956795 RepID=UPI00209A8AF8|nr:hypothetical protein [Stieleria tagensis]MCO8121865.1 hypothetical protein [Stieleria tagensis]